MKKILSVLGASLVLAGALVVTSCSDAGEFSDVKTDTIKSLAAPKNLTATASYGSVALTWDAVKGAAAYRIVRYDVTNKDSIGTKLGSSNYYTVLVSNSNTADGAKSATAYYIDSDSALTDGVKYKYEVTALASTTNADYVARTLYYQDGSAKSVEVTAEVPASVDAAAVAALGSNVSLSFNNQSSATATIEFPTVAGLEYSYRLVNVSDSSVEDAFESVAKGEKFLSAESFSTYGNLNYRYNPTASSNTVKTRYIDSSSTSVVYNSNNDGNIYQLFLEVRARNTAKYGTAWTVVNTGVTAKYIYSLSNSLTFTSNKIGGGKFLFVVRDSGFIDDETPASYTYTLKSYKLSVKDNAVVVATEATAAHTKTLTDFVYDEENTVYGTEVTISDIAEDDSYLFILERTGSEGTILKSVSVKGYVDTVYDDAYYTASYYKERFSISNVIGTSTSAPSTANAARTVYTNKATVSYDIGTNYTGAKLYRAKVASTYIYYSSLSDDFITSTFEEVAASGKLKNDSSSNENHESGTWSKTIEYTDTEDEPSNMNESYYLYVLVATNSENKTVLTTTSGQTY